MSAGFQIGSGREQATYSRRDEFLAGLDWTIERARRSLLDLQHHEGYWNAALEAPAQMNAEFIIFNHFMDSVDRDLEARIAKYLLETQQPDGSWNLFPEGEGYASYTIEAYAALKLAGMRADDEPLVRARRWIMANGGITRAGTLARFYLASIGLVPWSATAACPVELMLLPNWFPLNIYELGSWARGTFVALALLQAAKPVRRLSEENLIGELYDHPPDRTNFKQPRGATTFSMRNMLNQADRILRRYDRHPIQRLRARAVAAAEKWLLDHQEANGSFGGIEPCYLLSAMALKAIGYRKEHPVITKSLEASRELIWEMGDQALYMPCVSPNWNTALACKALLASGMSGDHPAFEAATRWFIDHQVFAKGDWSIKRPDLEPGGWPFEFFNDAYPDVDDSAVIVEVLSEMGDRNDPAQARAIEAGANWVSGMQSKDGGFAAFDTDTDSKWLNELPLADVEAITDPSCPDLTGRVLEMLGALHRSPEDPVAHRAIEWLSATRRPRVHGGGDGASITSTEPFPRCSDCAQSASTFRSRGFGARLNGSNQSRTATADGARAASATRIRAGADAERAPPRKRRGRSSESWRAKTKSANTSFAACAGCWNGKMRRARGMRPRSPATDFPIISTCATTSIRIIFRCSRWPTSARGSWAPMKIRPRRSRSRAA